MVANYPQWAAGDPITASALNYTQGDVIVKTVATIRASTTTLADDPDLTTTLDANATYSVEFLLKPGSNLAADFKTQWTVPSGASGNRTALGPGSTATDGGADNIAMHSGTHGFATTVNYSGVRDVVTNLFFVYESAIVITTSSGTCAIQWAQVTSTAVNTQLGAGSMMRVKRVA